MKVKNHTQTVQIGASVLLPSLGRLTPEVFSKMKEYSAATPETKESLKADLLASLPKEVKKELAELGLETPIDVIPVSLTLSNFLFDVYMSGVTMPSAPLAKKIAEKEILDLADKLKNPEEFEFDGKFLNGVRDMMLDDKKWENAKIHVEFKRGEEQLAIPLIHRAANFFPEILEAATKIFMEIESAKTESSPVSNS